MRLAKYLAHAGVASRRQSERLIVSGRVDVDGEPVTDPARDVGDANVIAVDGRRVQPEAHEHYILNKPVGVVSTADDPQGRTKVTDLIDSPARLYPVGRLDADSSGLIILTNDGELANRLTHPRYEVPKVYIASVSGRPTEAELDALGTGVMLDDGVTSPAGVELVEDRGATVMLRLTIHEGRKRQVRRMCDAIGHRVLELRRTSIGDLELGDLELGQSRQLSAQELERLRAF